MLCGGARRRPRRRSPCARRRSRRPAPAAGSPRRSSRCAGPGARATLPTELERRRLALLGTAAIFAARAARCSGPGPAPFLAAAGPAAADLGGRAAGAPRYRRAVERGLAEVAIAVADALAVGRSARAALAAAAASLEGPPAREMERVRAELALGAPTRDALDGAAPARRLAAGRLVRGRAALPAARRRRPRDPAAPLRRRRRRPRPHRGRRALGDRAGALHRPAGRRDAGRRGAARRAARAGLRRRPARRTRPRRRCSRSPPALQLAGFAAIRRLSRVDERMTRAARRGRRAARLRRGLGARRRRRRAARRRAARRAARPSRRAAPARSARPPSGSACRGGSSAPGSPGGSSRGRSSPRSSPARRSAALVALAAVPAVPPRLGIVVAAVLVVAGFLGPDALLERAARRRRARFVAALPDALDMLAVGAASGRDPATGLGEIAARHQRAAGGRARRARSPRSSAAARCATRSPTLRERVPGAEVGALAAALERSRTYGSPLAEQLHLQATRAAPRRSPADRGARRPRGAEDPARRRAGARALGAADDRRRDHRPLRRAARSLVALRAGRADRDRKGRCAGKRDELSS